MKLHHARVLALIIATLAMPGCQEGCKGKGQQFPTTWYLLAPPHATRNGQLLVGTDLKAPFGKWEKKSVYARLQDCEQAKTADLRDGTRVLSEAPKDASSSVRSSENARWASGYEMVDEQCVADIDPRLRNN